MLHLDEGLIHELLDGELDPAEAETVRRHIAECGDCLRLYQEALDMVSEANRVIASLDDTRPELNEGTEELSGIPAPPAANVGAGAPVVLMPTGVQVPRWRRVRPRSGLWAAALLLLAGGGYLVFGGKKEEPVPSGTPTLATFPLTSKEPAANDSLADAQAEARAAAALSARPPLGVAAQPAARDTASRDTARDSTARRPASRDSTPQLAAADRRQAGRTDEAAQPATTAKGLAAPPAAPRPQAARSERAAVDFGAVDNAAAARESAATPAPAPTLDVQAQITSRIGLDDAKRTLGAPLHAIDGLRPRLVGLIPGRLVPGADPGRDVVRAVYLDQNGQPFYLDQQRVGAAGPRRTGGIVKGDVQLFLNGNVSPDSARALEQRLR